MTWKGLGLNVTAADIGIWGLCPYESVIRKACWHEHASANPALAIMILKSQLFMWIKFAANVLHGTSFTKKGRQSASGEGRKPPGICPGATMIVAP